MILYVEDTLRADRLGTYGYQRATDPHLQAVASRGTTFDHAYAPSNWTRASVGLLMTSLAPPAHGAGNYNTRVPNGVETLAETLRDAGYLTVSPITNYPRPVRRERCPEPQRSPRYESRARWPDTSCQLTS